MTAFVFPDVLASGGLVFAFQETTMAGLAIIATLFVASIFSWSVMITKFRMIRFARKQTERFFAIFRKNRQPLHAYETGLVFEGSPAYAVYRAGCEELAYQMLGSSEVDDTFTARVEVADRISPAQMRAVTAAMERAVGESGLRMESQMIILATAVSGSPFLGLLGTVWGVMDAFSGVAMAGTPNLAAMAPGVSGALLTTVVGLLVAIPAMFGYNFLVTSLRSMIVQTDNFAAQVSSDFEHRFVSYDRRN
ncbi:MAG: MotA/TolQ/ExbB proton channel family protein [Chthoniobacterales bacterium]